MVDYRGFAARGDEVGTLGPHADGTGAGWGWSGGGGACRMNEAEELATDGRHLKIARPWRSIHGGSRRLASGGTVTRFVTAPAAADRQQASLPPGHPAIIGATTLFPKSVVDAADTPRLLVSGHNSAKLGRVVLKGPWRGMPIFLLTLVERETCPATCGLWAECFGNAMPLARRHRYSPELVARLEEELRAKSIEHRRTGFVVRLHNLGDFPDAGYAKRWLHWMAQMPQIHAFGYTAHRASTEVGRIINTAGAMFPDRWAIRFSVPPDDDPQPRQATTIWRQAEGPNVPEGIVCPAQTHKTAACATCGLCWAPAAASKRIVFIGHGMRRRHA